MSNITALLTGVCMYPAAGYPALPLCANDVQAVKKALIAGLNVSESSIMVCGHHGTPTTKDLITGLYSSISETDNEDTFIFYFVVIPLNQPEEKAGLWDILADILRP